MSGLTFGIDIGGTFTDVVAYDEAARIVHVAKVPSTPPRLADGFIAGIRRILDDLGRSPADVTRVVHGTTVGTNAVLERRGATLGILTTAGFEDVLTIGRMKRSDMYDLEADPEVPLFLAPRRRIRGIPERVGSRGEVLTPLDADAVRQTVSDVVEREGVESIVVCYLFSYLRADHERQTREIIRELYPTLHVSLSSEVDAKFREYERLVMTAFDAYIRPIIQNYLRALDADLLEQGIAAPLQVMQSRGAISGSWVVVERPIATVLSGPAAGVIGGIDAARRSGFDDAVTIDIGGTSCDVALVRGAKPVITTEGRIERFPLRLPMIDVHTIGAGGGSIAWVDAAGGLKVGPRSAGSRPGPAAYAQGGDLATVTDASVVLGYLNPNNFAGGTMTLRPDLAERVIDEHVARPLGLDVPAAGAGVHRIVNSGMAQALRLVSVRRGHDPRRLALVALGGAGPVHAGRLAQAIGIPTVVVPPTPGVLSALGLLLADVEHEFSRTFRSPTSQADPADLEAIFAELDAVCHDRMRRENVAVADVAHFAELRYVRQSYELEVALPMGPLTRDAIDTAAAEFHRQHERVYGFCLPNAAVELVTLRTVHTAHLAKPELSQGASVGARRTADPIGSRDAYFEETGRYEPVPIYDRASLGIGQEVEGPAILEQPDTTTVVYPSQSIRVDEAGNVILTVGSSPESGRVREAGEVARRG